MIRKPSVGDAAELDWFKSSYSSSSEGDDCVEIAATPGTVHVRDSKRARGPRLTVTPTAWADFIVYASLA
ncbi:DUF397 domain-containing protein [Streptomyces alfalfae]|uniref:DUF397 domain-containing protein n=2 Tax=Streptomyces alfalfae TaxID=1642299 RepID=A0ABN4VM17_9ACTN|nr:DUF397 domain-containing protein [Streptomyces alfalfae]AYA19047.1 DUF397 domain-containing protein [Streptomyces fradiae]APY88633.1 DUF397 domain-containing protein [Streptomyces alfalfae]QUI31433.1 DUF397 domain-containing protein [Streptomyces alfalfae]RXX36520.1 DUF397 domain-containing protein [Streptomyces alfalfae]RZN07071.1 DUF397 domain-containing protein [Streptomyces alfalfae]